MKKKKERNEEKIISKIIKIEPDCKKMNKKLSLKIDFIYFKVPYFSSKKWYGSSIVIQKINIIKD